MLTWQTHLACTKSVFDHWSSPLFFLTHNFSNISRQTLVTHYLIILLSSREKKESPSMSISATRRSRIYHSYMRRWLQDHKRNWCTFSNHSASPEANRVISMFVFIMLFSWNLMLRIGLPEWLRIWEPLRHCRAFWWNLCLATVDATNDTTAWNPPVYRIRCTHRFPEQHNTFNGIIYAFNREQ